MGMEAPSLPWTSASAGELPDENHGRANNKAIGLFCFYQASGTDLFCEALVAGPQQPGRCPVEVVGLVWVEAAK